MRNRFVALAIVVFALFAGASVTVEALTLSQDASIVDACNGSNC